MSIAVIQWRVVVICALILLIDGYDILAMAMIVPSLASEWQLAPPAFAPALSLCIAGVAIGSALAGKAGDRFGRRLTLLAFLAGGALATAATAAAGSIVQLTVLRFLTGIGLGGTIPLALALSAERLPIDVRSMLLTVVIAATPLGSALASLLAPFLIDTWSWRAVFIAGAIAPAIALALAYALLPESQEWLTAKREPATLSALFAGERAIATALLWLAFLANQFVLLLLGSWLPTLLTGVDSSRDRALYATTVYSIGGMLSGPLLGWLSDRYRPQRVLLATYTLAAFAVASLSAAASTTVTLFAVALLAGAGVSGSQIVLNAFAAILYPTPIRASGVGWALAVGRIGAIASPLVAGSLLGSGWHSRDVFLVAAAAPCICFVAIAALDRADRARRVARTTT
jgi:AAHS family 4-hydroxybenzoate transporter-like MFS transporter